MEKRGILEVMMEDRGALSIREFLKKYRLVADGAMGTYYSTLKREGNLLSELDNDKDPEIIKTIHKNYIEAGANLIRINTFACYPDVLGVDEAESAKLCRNAVKIAKQAVIEAKNNAELLGKEESPLEVERKEVFIAGDIGPCSVSNENAERDYKANIDIFIEEKLPVIIFETFTEEKDVLSLAEYVKEKSPETFVIASFCINGNGTTGRGISLEQIVHHCLESKSIDAFGFNCGIGSSNMYKVLLSANIKSFNKYFYVSPNAGYPEFLNSRMVFINNTSYYIDYMKQIASLGASIIGSCCGTTPEYTRKISEFVRELPPVELAGEYKEKLEVSEIIFASNEFDRKLCANKRVIVVELDPPYYQDDEKMISRAKELMGYDIDMIDIADSPQGKSRVDSVLMSVKLQNMTSIPCMPHITCRDRNMISVRSTMLGAYVNNIRNMLIVTGDPIPADIRSSATGVFDYNSEKMMQFLNEMNRAYFSADPIVFGGAINQGRPNVDYEIKRIKKKMEAGARYFMTQPVYSDRDIEVLDRMKKETGAKILCGIMPLISYKNAFFVKNEIAGIVVPDEVLAMYSPDMNREEGEEAGRQISKEVIKKAEPVVDGFYFMLPFNRINLLDGLVDKKKGMEL